MNTNIKNKVVILIFLALLVLLLNACDRETCCSDGSTGFSGFVTDSISDLPIDSARISLDDTLKGFSLYTDSTGFYEGVMFGGFDNLFVQKSGYITKSGKRQSGEFVVRIDFRLAPDSI